MAFEMDQVIASGSVQELVCQTINFGANVEEIKEIRKTVIIDKCEVVFDKVIINGRLRKDIMFKAANAGFPIPGTVQGCVGVTTTVTGAIQDTDVEIVFNALIPVPGAQPGDKCVVLQAFVEGESEEPADIQTSGAFRALVDKSIIFLCVKVVRGMIANQVTGAAGVSGVTNEEDLCPPRRTTGLVLGGGNGIIPPPRRGLLPGTWIGPTLLFAGVINPGIPTTIPPRSPIVATTPSQIQVTPVQTVDTNAGDIITGGGTIS